MRLERCILLTVIGIFVTSVSQAQDIADGASLKVEGRVAFTEGPAWHPSGNVYFSDIANDRIMRRDRTGVIHVYRTPSGRSNGLLFDSRGRLLACEGGGLGSNRRVTRTELDGTLTVLADSFNGHKFNSPNDLTMDSQGRVYFTDPRYRDRSDMQILDSTGEPVEGVYRIDGPGKVSQFITHEVDRPNGICISPSEDYLYVADNVNDGPRGQGGNRKLWRFDLKKDGSVDPGSRTLMFDWGTDRGPDGMAIDREGRVYVTAGFNFPSLPRETAKKFRAGVYVLSEPGKLLQFIPVPADMITNCAFGGDDGSTLFITAGHKLWSLQTNATGYSLFPGAH